MSRQRARREPAITESAPSEPRGGIRRSNRAAALGLIALALAAHAPAMWCGFIWDDDMYVTQNPVLRDGEGLRSIWTDLGATPQYYPLVHTSFWIESRLWGLTPWGYHATNILLHALNACLLWRLLERLEVPGAWLAAALFAVHPVHVESVAWVTERKNVLSGQGHVDEAIRAHRRAVELEPDFAEAHLALSRIHEHRSELDQAVRHARTAVRLSPGPEENANLGRILWSANLPRESIGALDEALRLDPRHAEAMANRAVASAALGNAANAERRFLAVLAVDARNGLALHGLARLSWERRRYREALEWLQRELEVAPGDDSALTRVAWIPAAAPTATLRDPPAALAIASELGRRTNEQAPELLDLWSVALAANGRFAEAKAVSERAVRLARGGGAEALADEIEGRRKLFDRGEGFTLESNPFSSTEPNVRQ